MATILVEVVYARPDHQAIVQLELDSEATVQSAIIASGLLEAFPEIRLEEGRVGIWGLTTPLDAQLTNYDRVEIYRPLMADPKVVRRNRARQQTSKNKSSLDGN